MFLSLFYDPLALFGELITLVVVLVNTVGAHFLHLLNEVSEELPCSVGVSLFLRWCLLYMHIFFYFPEVIYTQSIHLHCKNKRYTDDKCMLLSKSHFYLREWKYLNAHLLHGKEKGEFLSSMTPTKFRKHFCQQAMACGNSLFKVFLRGCIFSFKTSSCTTWTFFIPVSLLHYIT